jgi:hypothetical protein
VNPFNIYASTHQHSRAVCEAVSAGTGFPIVQPSPLRPGGVVMYGFLRGLLPTLREAQRLHRPWVYADRGYLKATYGDNHSGYFRFTRDAWQHTGQGEASPDRWERLGIEIKPWRKDGEHILVCPPGDVFANAVGNFSGKSWLENTLEILAKHSQRRVLVRHKVEKDKRPLSVDLERCHALVTHMSNTAVEALLAGVPVFCTGYCASSSMGRTYLDEIENPLLPEDRYRWASVLAANQWTLEEMRSGLANHLFE